jgi:threonine/homoserine/homoserine lactone efflux protein
MNLPSATTLISGLILGWSVAWPPGPVNAEMIRRGLQPKSDGGGFWAAWRIGLGACTGDFLWALGVSAGAGAIVNTPRIRMILGIISLILLLFLASTFSLGAWRAWRTHRQSVSGNEPKQRRRMPGYLLGLTLALTSPWNIGFWLAVIGSQSGQMSGDFSDSVFFAIAVICGALIWGCFLSLMIKLGARIFSRPEWQVATQALTALVMVYFAIRLVRQLF